MPKSGDIVAQKSILRTYIVYKICLLLRSIIEKNVLSQAYVILATFYYSFLDLWWVFHTAIYFALQRFDFERTGGSLSQKTCIVRCIRYLHFYLYKYWYDSYTRKQQHKRKRLTKLRITARTKLFTKLCTKYIIDKAELHQHMLILISRFLLLIM